MIIIVCIILFFANDNDYNYDYIRSKKLRWWLILLVIVYHWFLYSSNIHIAIVSEHEPKLPESALIFSIFFSWSISIHAPLVFNCATMPLSHSFVAIFACISSPVDASTRWLVPIQCVCINSVPWLFVIKSIRLFFILLGSRSSQARVVEFKSDIKSASGLLPQ